MTGATPDLTDFVHLGKKIIGIGKGYKSAWPELKEGDALPEPIVFLKPTSTYTSTGKTIDLPHGCDVVYEVELAVIIGKEGRDIPLSQAEEHVGGYAVALDIAAANVDAEAIRKGLNTFTPVGRFLPLSSVKDTRNLQLDLQINGRTVQADTTANMTWSISHLISYLSTLYTLYPGDMILTGTPDGVGNLQDGDDVLATLSGPGGLLDTLHMKAVLRKGGYRPDGNWLARL